MPGVFLFQPAKLFFCLSKIEVVHLIERLPGFKLNRNAGDQNNGGILTYTLRVYPRRCENQKNDDKPFQSILGKKQNYPRNTGLTPYF